MFSEQEIQQLREKGWSDQDIQTLMIEEAKKQNQGMSSMFSQPPEDNLVKWQLELDNILERIEHILKGDRPTFKNGVEIWEECKDPRRRLFNDRGVDEIMGILTMHINRNTILSNYAEEDINRTVFDLGERLNDLIFMRYDDFGLDTPEKRKNYPMIVMNIVDMVRSTYLRALNGGERESLRTARQLIQQENLSGMMPIQTKKSIFSSFNFGKK